MGKSNPFILFSSGGSIFCDTNHFKVIFNLIILIISYYFLWLLVCS